MLDAAKPLSPAWAKYQAALDVHFAKIRRERAAYEAAGENRFEKHRHAFMGTAEKCWWNVGDWMRQARVNKRLGVSYDHCIKNAQRWRATAKRGGVFTEVECTSVQPNGEPGQVSFRMELAQ